VEARSLTTWDESRLRVGLVASVVAKVVGLVVLFDWTGRALSPFDLTKSVWSRAWEAVIVALLVGAVVSYGPAIVPRTRLHLAVLAVLAANAISAVFADVPYLALFGTDGRYLGLFFVLDMVVLYVAVASAFRSIADWTALLIAVAGAVVVSLGYAWIQFAGYDPLPWTGSQFQRPFSTIGNPNTYGHLLSVALGPAALVALSSIASRRWAAGGVAAALALAILGISAVVATRGTVLGIATALVAVPALTLRSMGVTRRNALLALAGAVGSGVVVAVAIAQSPLGARVKDTLAGQSLEDRLLVWRGSLDAFAARPVVGWGPDSFIAAWPSVRPVEFARLVGPGLNVDSAHDFILHAAATTGVVGTLALIVAAVAFSFALLRMLPRRGTVIPVLVAALAGYWAHALVSVGTIGVDWVPWLVFGGIASFSAIVPGPSKRRESAMVVAVVGAAAIITIAVGLRVLDANEEALKARHTSDLRQGPDAVIHARRAIDLDPGRADYWNELGRAYGAADRWADAVDAFEGASARAPYSATYLSNLGRALAQLALAKDDSRGGADAAIAAARRAAVLDRNEPPTHLALAEIALALDQPVVSLGAAVDAILIAQNPNDPHYDGLAAAASAKVADPAVARRELERALASRETARLRVALAQVDLRQGDKAAALTNARRALELDPANTDAAALIRAVSGQ